MPSNDWEYFMDNFFGNSYMMWHDGINPQAAAYLKGEEREKAEDMLIEELPTGNYWAPMGLGAMKSQKAIPHLKKQLEKCASRQRLEIALALGAIEYTIIYLPHVIMVLKYAPSPYDRLVAAMKLRNFPYQEVVLALFEGVMDEDYLVRNHSSESLLFIHKLPHSISEYKEIFKLIITEERDNETGDMVPKTEADWKQAVEMLRAVISGKKQ